MYVEKKEKKKHRKKCQERIRQNHKIRWLKLTSIIHKKNTKWNCKKKKAKSADKNKTKSNSKTEEKNKTSQNLSLPMSTNIIECIFCNIFTYQFAKFILLHSERSSDMVGHKAMTKKTKKTNTKHLKCYKNKYKKWRFISSFHWILFQDPKAINKIRNKKKHCRMRSLTNNSDEEKKSHLHF